ncbi:cysteine hydrolase family protein [Flavobacterium daejeonense]|uniref:cysteine hydrolase family protein n=1 Tax=Flavobacterium daejeonense TaxID=350893 RepID=UPI000478896F|nr:cysteine hydrolase family protein [Flavobacterium daejeonense]
MKKALLIVDIQNDYFVNGKMQLFNSEEAGKKAKLILEKFRSENLPVFHIQHIATRTDATFFIKGTNGVEIHDYVKPLKEEIVIEKTFPNSFRETDLLKYLQVQEITDLVIVGMMTHMCIDATTRAAKDFGFNCIIIEDACATKDLEVNNKKVKANEVQTAFLSALNYFYAKIIDTEKFLLE